MATNNDYPAFSYIEGLKHKDVCCDNSIYAWHKVNVASNRYKCKAKIDGKQCTASLTIDDTGKMIRYNPNHLNDHPPITTDYKQVIRSKIADLKK